MDGWTVIIHEAHILLNRISAGIQGFQRPTLGSVRQLDIMTGPFIQIVHINNNHWVCFSSINSPPGYVDIYDSLTSPVTQELLELAFDLTGPSLVYGQDPMNVTYNISQMHQHLLHCLNGGIITPFPTT